jgi:hypothetical protein
MFKNSTLRCRPRRATRTRRTRDSLGDRLAERRRNDGGRHDCNTVPRKSATSHPNEQSSKRADNKHRRQPARTEQVEGCRIEGGGGVGQAIKLFRQCARSRLG